VATLLLDTSVLIDVLNGKHGRDLLLERLLTEGHLLACCSVNVTEVFAGVRPKEQARTEAFLRSLEFFEITWEIARQAGLLKREWARKGVTLSVSDVTIAALAITRDLALLTDNVRHYPMREIRFNPLPG
jgi:predicted nucleic acid-binding protein